MYGLLLGYNADPPESAHMSESPAESSVALLRRVQDGDQNALDVLLTRYHPRLMRWASRRLPPFARDLTETQDVVQETLLAAFRRIEAVEIRDDGSLQAYLRRAVLNRIRMEIRRANRKPAPDVLASGVPATGRSPLEQAIGAEALGRYERALDGLAPTERELIVARLELGLTHEELAAAFDKPSANAARMALQRALLRLASHMKA